jgi:hypothetical protein
MGQASADPSVNPQLLIVNGAQGSVSANSWVDPGSGTWQVVKANVAAAGATDAQVEVAWVKQAIGSPYKIGGFPAHAQALRTNLKAIARNLKTIFPNIKIAYFSSRTHPYTTALNTPNPEPYAYESGFSEQWAIADLS